MVVLVRYLSQSTYPFYAPRGGVCTLRRQSKLEMDVMDTKGPKLRQILSANIKEQRQILGISQEKLAEMAGLSWQTVNSIECKRTWVSDNTLDALAAVFKIETFQLLMPPETRAALSLNPTKALRQLAEAKKAYDATFSGIFNKTT